MTIPGSMPLGGAAAEKVEVFPSVVSTAVTQYIDYGGSNPPKVANLPASRVVGNWLVGFVFIESTNQGLTISMPGWAVLRTQNLIYGSNDIGRGFVVARQIDGTETSPASFSFSASTSGRFPISIVAQIAGASGNFATAGQSSGALEANINLPNCVAPWGIKKTLWLAAGYNMSTPPTGAPTGFSGLVTGRGNADGFSTQIGVGFAWRQVEAGNLDPDRFSGGASARDMGITVAVEPA